jgi:predicted nucleic acid-binding Zn ribbon protein
MPAQWFLVMTTYVYETIPQTKGQKPKVFEYRQSMTEAALTKHPETGEPVRRRISGGFGLMSKKPHASATPSKGGCGHACGCHH